ncbi:type II toxin-antitoxin system RelE/ParE family toxin [Candidatus Peregrinibacteria bacterium]|nr:type II toxin-antitoxin system RelE/ParE family toxin [Candidatus Peregrinibacteria bacterium]
MTMIYRVIILARAKKQLSKLPPKEQRRIVQALASLETDPFRGKQLHGDYEGAWAIRVWPYRIIYTIKKELVTVTVVRIGHRKDVYR